MNFSATKLTFFVPPSVKRKRNKKAEEEEKENAKYKDMVETDEEEMK